LINKLSKKDKNKVLFITSSQHFADMFLRDFLKYLSISYEIHLITNFKHKKESYDNIHLYDVSLERKISLSKDLISVIKIIYYTLKIKPQYLVTTTPKCTIFGTIIKLLIPKINRSHIYTGITWTNMKGLKKLIFKFLDKMNISYCDKVIFDSKDQITFMVNKKFDKTNFHLIHKGSIKGVDTKIFYKYESKKIIALKQQYKIPLDVKIILYLGRLDLDKGITDLIKAFKLAHKEEKKINLLLVGKDEMQINKYLNNLNDAIKNKIIYLDHQKFPEIFFNIADIFCLPSKREGFGNVVIESSSCETPVIGTNIYGLRSSLINHFNGLVFEVGNVIDLKNKIKLLLKDHGLRNQLGQNGREFVIKNFKTNDVFNSLEEIIFNNV